MERECVSGWLCIFVCIYCFRTEGSAEEEPLAIDRIVHSKSEGVLKEKNIEKILVKGNFWSRERFLEKEKESTQRLLQLANLEALSVDDGWSRLVVLLL
jgi:hypothetical protein